jgi:hypothetical protein
MAASWRNRRRGIVDMTFAGEVMALSLLGMQIAGSSIASWGATVPAGP